MDDAVERLTYAIIHEQDRKLCFLVGSGMSIPNAPSTAALCDYMYAELRMTSDRPQRGTGAEYRILADGMKRRRGILGLSRLLRTHLDPDPSGDHATPIDSDAWKLPPQQASLARLVSLMPAHRRGPIFTTNFDPFVEVALHRASVHAQAVIASGATTVNLDALVESVPVVHLHGFWTMGSTLNTDAELLSARPGVEDEVLRSIQDCLVVVMGYGGWDDAFTRTVENNLKNGRFATTGTEFAWMHHRAAPLDTSSFLSRVAGMPQVVEYENVNLSDLVAGVAKRIEHETLKRGPGVRGLWPVVSNSLGAAPDRAELWHFLDGAEPSYAISRGAPRLSAFERLNGAVSESISKPAEGDIFVIAIGPAGEGKSVALRQVASRLADENVFQVLEWQVGSPNLNSEAITVLRQQEQPVVVFIDEADLVLDGLASEVRNSPKAGSRLIFVGAMHSQFRDKVEYWRRNVGHWALVEIAGINQEDSTRLAEYWLENGLLPSRYTSDSKDRVADIIWESAATEEGASLYGSMLHLWDRDSLLDRARNTLGRLGHRSIGGIPLSDVLLGIALTDLAWEEEYPSTGVTLAALGEMCSIGSADVLSVVLEPLGKEASLSRVGSAIFIRHPAIRDALLDTTDEETELRIGRLLGKTGGLMRRRSAARSDFLALTGLSRRLKGKVALQVAQSVMVASQLLESRVSYLATCRDEGAVQGLTYARELADHLEEFSDFRPSVRGFLVEWSIHERSAGQTMKAAALCAYSLSDAQPGFSTHRQIAFALTQLIACARQMKNPQLSRELIRASTPLLSRLSGEFAVEGDIRSTQMADGTNIRQQVFAFKRATQPLSRVLSVDRWSFQNLMRDLSSGGHAPV